MHYHYEPVPHLQVITNCIFYTCLDLCKVDFIISKLLLKTGQGLYVTNKWLSFRDLIIDTNCTSTTH